MAPRGDDYNDSSVDYNDAPDLMPMASTLFEVDDDAKTVDFLIHEASGEKTGCGRGIIQDIRKTVGTWWVKEMTNFNQKTIAVGIFIYFAAVAPAITFGAVYSRVTNDSMGAIEMLIATAWFGIAYSLIGGQPIMINGGTGPILAFHSVLLDIATSFDVNFLTLNAWTGLWVALMLFMAAFFDWNRMMNHATRFTDEIFALLIAAIFIVDALGSPFSSSGIAHYFKPGHSAHQVHVDDPDYSYMAVAFLSLICCLGTTWLAFTLRGFKYSSFLPNDMCRDMLYDFSVVLSILVFTCLANITFKNTPVERLNVPDRIEPTQICCDSSCMASWPQDCNIPLEEAFGRRPWFVNLLALGGKTWLPIFAAVPALLAFILVFLDDAITWHLLNHPSHKLTHGDAYNWDTVLVAIQMAVNSLLGLPWVVASTVPCLIHLNALAEKNEKGKIVSVHQTRLTNLLIHVLMLVSLFILPVLKLIPVPVLYGVFLFMGLASLGTNHFFQRILLFFMQPSKYPQESYTKLRPSRIHWWTFSQIVMFCLLLIVRSISVIAITFPIVIKACIPVRMYIMPRLFTNEEMIMLDTDDETVQNYLVYKERKASRDIRKKFPSIVDEEDDFSSSDDADYKDAAATKEEDENPWSTNAYLGGKN